MLKIKNIFQELIQEIKIKWREIVLLLWMPICELFAFSALTTHLSVAATVTVSILLFVGLVIFTIIALKNKNMNKQEKKQFLIFVILALILGIARSYLYIFSLIVAYLFYKDKKSLYKWMFLISISTFLIFLLFTFIKAIPDFPYYRGYGSYISVRHTFGFIHPNQCLKYYFISVICGYLWLCNNHKNTLIYTIAMLPLYGIISYNTHCQTGAFVLGIFFVLINLPEFLIKWIKAKWLYIGAVVITILITISYPLNIDFINEALSGRPNCFFDYVVNYPWNIIVGKCYDPLLIHLSSNPLDNTYLFTLFDGGIVALIAILYLYNLAFKNNKDTKITIVLGSMLVYGLFEAFVTVFTDILFVLVFIELFDQHYGKNSNSLIKEEAER